MCPKTQFRHYARHYEHLQIARPFAMSLLLEIQESLLEGNQDIGPILFKLRYLASRLGSNPLEDWVKHESEGYPPGTEVPDYRKIPVAYAGTFSGIMGSGIQNAPIPPYLIQKFAGKEWMYREFRQSLAGIEDLLEKGKDTGEPIRIDASDLILVLQGNMYEDMACNSVTGRISRSAVTEIQNAVRSRVLELTIQLEKTVPEAAGITIGPLADAPTVKNTDAVSQITQNIIHGNVTHITSSGEGAQIQVNVGKGDSGALVNALADAGILKTDASELAEIVASEEPEGTDQPFGKKAKRWLAENLPKALDGTWRVGMDVATKVLTEAVKKYYGIE